MLDVCSPCQQRKCAPYWPENDTEGDQETFGDVTVKITGVEIYNDYVIRVFMVKKGVSSIIQEKTFTEIILHDLMDYMLTVIY